MMMVHTHKRKSLQQQSKFKQSIYRLHWVDLLCEGREYSAYYTVFSTSKKTSKYHKTCSMYTNLHNYYRINNNLVYMCFKAQNRMYPSNLLANCAILSDGVLVCVWQDKFCVGVVCQTFHQFFESSLSKQIACQVQLLQCGVGTYGPCQLTSTILTNTAIHQHQLSEAACPL